MNYNSQEISLENAIDVPPTPSVVIEPPKMIFPEPTGEQKRAAPVPPTELAETTKAYNPYIPLSAARSSPQLKNVISELKTKQSKEDVVDDEENEYVRVNQRETKKHDPEMSTIKEEGQNEMESNKSNPEQNTTGKQIEQILTPVPKPRRTVAVSLRTTSANINSRLLLMLSTKRTLWKKRLKKLPMME